MDKTFDILLAEDNDDIRELIKINIEEYFLSEKNIRNDNVIIVEARNGQEAEGQLKDKEFNLIITDLEMPILDGRELIYNLKHNSSPNAQTPILVLSANTKNLEIDLKTLSIQWRSHLIQLAYLM